MKPFFLLNLKVKLIVIIASEVRLLTLVLVEEVCCSSPLPLHNQGKDLLRQQRDWNRNTRISFK